jgi:hypothetical protein
MPSQRRLLPIRFPIATAATPCVVAVIDIGSGERDARGGAPENQIITMNLIIRAVVSYFFRRVPLSSAAKAGSPAR